jgi:hypothetical protein
VITVILASLILLLATIDIARGATRLAPNLNDHQARNIAVICHVFRRYCGQAVRVAACESGWSTAARNGQHLGLFQMGSSERRLYGHGVTAWAQARAAYRYFVASGRDWSPWTCGWAA